MAIRAAPNTIAPAEVSVKNQPMNARESSIASAARCYRGENPLQDRDRGWRAAGNGDIHRDDVRYAAAARVALTEDSARAAAIADRDNQLRVGSRLPGALERGLHIARDRARSEERRVGNEERYHRGTEQSQ